MSREVFTEILKWAPIGLFRARKDGTFLAVNTYLAHMLGYPTEQALTAKNLEEDVYVDPAERRANLVRVKSEGTGLRLEVRWRKMDGTQIWVELTGHAVRHPGETGDCFEGIAIDITERKNAEERARNRAALLDRAQDAIYVEGIDGVIGFWNMGASKIYGWSAAEACGRNAEDLLRKEGPAHAEILASTKEKGEWIGERTDRGKDGRTITVESRCSIVRNETGEPASMLVINTDITEKKNLERQFLRAQRMESIGTLAAGIAHDLNNVLAPITMSIAMLRNKISDQAGLRWLNTIDVSAERAAGIVRQVLGFGRGIEGDRVVFQPAHVLKEVLKIASETFPRSIEIRKDVPTDLWMIIADPTQMHQILLNLCLNARDAMPSGGTLTIGAENVELDEHYAKQNIDARPGRYLSFSVTDSGSGIPREVLDRIFDPFFTTKPPGKGTGLGLSTALAIVRSHGGFINVYTESGRGTTFRVYLPAGAPPGAAEAKKTDRRAPAGRGELILVVDDEPSIREITKGMLESNGYAALTACNGSEALGLYNLRKTEIRATITDLMMPVMDGSSTIRELRKLDPSSIIIASSGFGVDHAPEAAPAAGATTFLKKPYTAEKLLQVLHEVLHKPEGPSTV